ncbi:amidohydrolase family protein [Nocardia asteroides]|uniref:amidohydrolase family protein n=1 Tax=Nocardia asteroides TaxID=1824 RepID=UPI0037CB03DD
MSGERIDVHQHVIPPVYREALRAHGIAAAGGRDLPDWTPEAALKLMASTRIGTAILSVSTPGTAFLDDPIQAVRLARQLNDYCAELTMRHPDRFGFFATLPMPDVTESATEAIRALDQLHADGVVLLGNSHGTYLGAEGQDQLFRTLDERAAVVLIHPADLPTEPVPGVPPFAADFLLDTTRAAYLLVRNGIRRRYPRIRFVLSHGGGFVPYAAHRMALAIYSDTGASPVDCLEDFSTFYFDTALSSSAASLPTLTAFARPGHILYGSDWPFAPDPAVQYFGAGLDEYPHLDPPTKAAIERTNALALFPRLGAAAATAAIPLTDRTRNALRRRIFRTAARAMSRSQS